MFHSVVEANGAMYLLGGSNGRQKLNDSWVSTDGRRVMLGDVEVEVERDRKAKGGKSAVTL